MPHPYGIELGTLMKMLKETKAKKIGAFLTGEFSRVSSAVAKRVCESAGVTTSTWVNAVTPQQAESLYNTLQEAKLKAPSTNCSNLPSSANAGPGTGSTWPATENRAERKPIFPTRMPGGIATT